MEIEPWKWSENVLICGLIPLRKLLKGEDYAHNPLSYNPFLCFSSLCPKMSKTSLRFEGSVMKSQTKVRSNVKHTPLNFRALLSFYENTVYNFGHSETVIFLVVLSTSFSGPIHVVLKEWIVSAVVALPYHQLAIKVEQLLSNPIGNKCKFLTPLILTFWPESPLSLYKPKWVFHLTLTKIFCWLNVKVIVV